MKEFIKTMNCGDLNKRHVKKKVSVIGWLAKKRNLGSLVFLDIRDRSGIVQVLVKLDEVKLPEVHNEYVLNVTGIVTKREVPNKDLKTGDIEIVAQEIVVINKAETTPLIINDETDALEEVRLKYRYLDLRRPVIRNNLITRSKIVKATHEFLDNNGFIEVETPLLNLSTPEGARDYLVPSRLRRAAFYALPQSPQLFKQLLMIGGFEKYYQIARCFRDEDLRSDRQPEFTQIDIETSFLHQDEILALNEKFIAKIFKDVAKYKLKLPLKQIDYEDAVNIYGSDKPDTRYGLTLHSLKEVLHKNKEPIFADSEYIKAFKIAGVAAETSRKVQDEYNLTAPKFGLKSYIFLKYINKTLDGSVAKYLSEKEKRQIVNTLKLKEDDLVVIAANNSLRKVNFGLGALRVELAKKYKLYSEDSYDVLWVVNFPLFEKNEETGEIIANHHPFTRPVDEDLDKLETEPCKVRSCAYDMVINGNEVGGGSLRIYDQDIQKRIFNVLGLTDEDVNKKFGWFMEALKYGTPPHGGIAYGLDRLAMIFCKTENIRDVIAFPKNLSAVCPITNAPQEVSAKQLSELGMRIVRE